MALNTLEYAVQLQTILDNAAEAALTSSWMGMQDRYSMTVATR